jgi:hypothetical protein
MYLAAGRLAYSTRYNRYGLRMNVHAEFHAARLFTMAQSLQQLASSPNENGNEKSITFT